MPYAAPDDVRGVLTPDPTFPTGTPAELTDATLDERIAAAAAQVDAALAARYKVPFPDGFVPRLVKDITVAIASWLAALTYRKSVDITATDPLTLRYQWALGLLGQLAKGEIDLPPGTLPDGERSPAAVTVQPYAGELFPMGSFGLARDVHGRIGVPWDY